MPKLCAVRDLNSPAHRGLTGSITGGDAERPEQVWARLAPLLCAPGRSAMRLYDAQTGKFSSAGRLTATLPSRPAALPLYTRAGRTVLVALDFDARRGGQGAVEADLATAVEWITRCGGVVITDRSPGGRHLWCPLAIGTSASAAEIGHLMRLLAARLPTLDITPNLNTASGCLSVPGTRTKDGAGYRRLDGPLTAAVEACTTRSHPALLPRLGELLGVLPRTAHAGTAPASQASGDVDRHCVGEGAERTLAPGWVRDDPLHPDIARYARTGDLAAGRRHWASHSEARMAVLTAALARGHSLAGIRLLLAPGGPWPGLGAAYTRYGHHADSALARDVERALAWLVHNPLFHRRPQHKSTNSQGGSPTVGPCGAAGLRRWLAAALAWADAEFKGKRIRWTVHAVLQSLAWHAQQAGRQVNGVWVVGVGGRSLSLGSGLLSEDAIWRVLRGLRDRPGAPLIRTRPGVGHDADCYALTSPAGVSVQPAWIQRVRVEPVHDAWAVLGHHLRRIYELVAYHGLTGRADLYAAARVGESAGDAAVNTLRTAGLLTRTGRGTVAAGPTTLHSIAAAHDTAATRADRITRYTLERAGWRAWLQDREQARETARAEALAAADPHTWQHEVRRSFWAAAMAHGPPRDSDHDHDQRVLELVADVLGGRIITATG